MRLGTLLAIASLALPAALGAQRIRPPRTTRGAAPQPAPLPPEIPAISHDLNYRRSRWSTEGYSMVSSLEVPTPSGGSTWSTLVGGGTRASYRFTDALSATADLTTSLLGSPVNAQTAEVGTRFSPLPLDRTLRPFVDVRAAYVHLNDQFVLPAAALNAVTGPNETIIDGARYSQGFGGVAGAGVEYSLTPRFALTSELTAMRDRMTAYRMTGLTGGIPSGTTYWMTSFRFSLGVRFNPVRSLHLDQNPRS